MSTVQENSKQKTLLILDFDQTISEGDLDFFKGKRDLNYRSEELERVDEFTSKEVNILTTQDVDEFIAKYPILMKKKLCSIIKDIIDNDHTVMIASFTEHPKALRYIIDKHLGLEKEYLEKINLISYGPDHYHGFDASLSEDEEEHRAGKNLHIIEGIKLFKKNNNGELPLRLILASSNNTTVARCNHIINEAKGRAIPEFQKYFAEALGYEVSDYYRMKKSPEFIGLIANLATEESAEKFMKDMKNAIDPQKNKESKQDEKSQSLTVAPRKITLLLEAIKSTFKKLRDVRPNPKLPKLIKYGKGNTARYINTNKEDQDQAQQINVAQPPQEAFTTQKPGSSLDQINQPESQAREEEKNHTL